MSQCDICSDLLNRFVTQNPFFLVIRSLRTKLRVLKCLRRTSDLVLQLKHELSSEKELTKTNKWSATFRPLGVTG